MVPLFHHFLQYTSLQLHRFTSTVTLFGEESHSFLTVSSRKMLGGEDGGSYGAAWICLIASGIFWGCMYVPARKVDTFDGSVFQWYMSGAILFTGVLIHMCLGPTTVPFSDGYRTAFPIYWEGIIGGLLWSTSNIFVIPSLKLLGLGVGFTLYHALNLLLGYLNGRLGLYGLHREKATLGMDFAVLCFLASFAATTVIRPVLEEEPTATSRQPTISSSQGSIDGSFGRSKNGGLTFGINSSIGEPLLGDTREIFDTRYVPQPDTGIDASPKVIGAQLDDVI